MPATALSNRERIRRTLEFREVDRLPCLEWAAWWDKTVERWHTEGLDPALDGQDLVRHCGLDPCVRLWPRGIHWDCPYKATHHGSGILASAGGDFAKIEPYLGQWPWTDSSMDPHRAGVASGEIGIWASVDGFFWLPRQIFGIEAHLYAFYDEPERMHRINAIQAAWIPRWLDACLEHTTLDFVCFSEDMSYNHGPMISKELFDQFLAPYYRPVVAAMHERGLKVFVDSDGDITQMIPWMQEVGVDGFLPLERQAGVDIPALCAQYPKFLFLGAYDKMVMDKGEAAIRGEFERLLPAMRRGGFLPSVDHQTPPGVSWGDYQIYARCFREYAAQAAGTINGCG